MLSEGQQIDRYHILHLISTGGMGSVYLAEDPRIGQQVAIKVMRAEASSDIQRDEEANRLFRREIKAIAMLDHPHILPLLDYGEERFKNVTLIYLVMPYRQEGSLLDRLRQYSSQHSFSLQQIAHIVQQAAGALQHAHVRQIIHQDVKPSNFLIHHREETPAYPDILLADFGIARLATATSVVSQSIRGTPTYMAPEQWEGRPVPATDQYGLAVMTYELLTGHPPFRGGFGQMMYQHLTAQPAPPSTLNPHLSKEIDSILLTALAKDPGARFTFITAFAHAFNLAVQDIQSVNAPVSIALSTIGDYHAILAISPTEALTGTIRTLNLPRERQVTVSVPGNIQDGQVIRLEGQGELLQDGKSRGALILTITVKSAEKTRIISNVSEAEAGILTVNIKDIQTIARSSDSRLEQSPANEILPITPSTALNQPPPVRQQPETPLPLTIWTRHPHRPKKRTLALLGLAILILLLFPIFYFAFASHHGGVSSASSSRPPQNVFPQLPSCVCTVKAPTGEYIGLSDGNFAFDTNRPDGALKIQAAAKMKVDNFDSANYLWQQAIAKDTNDAEALIYLEDLRVLESGHPRLTIVIGTTLTGGGIATGQANLRGVYVAQEEYNIQQKLPDSVQVFLLIANSGSDQTYATLVAKQIAQLSLTDKTIVGVMGWTLDPQLLDALPVLAAAHIPMVSNTGSDELTGRSSYSFRIVASGARQGSLGAQALEKILHAKTVALFTDPQDDQSRGVATGFTQTFTGDGNIIVATEHFTVGKPQANPTLLQDALSKHPDALYFAGRASDAAPLLAHLRPTDPPIMGPNSLYLVQGYPQSAHSGLSHMHFTAGAYPDEWENLGLGTQKPPFFADYRAAYDPKSQHPGGTYLYDRAPANDVLSYDAISVLLYASRIALTKGPFLGSDLRGSDLWQILNGITGKNAFQGVSGAISFGPDGGVIDKATVIMCFSKDNFFKEEAVLGQFLVGAPPLTQFPTRSICS